MFDLADIPVFSALPVSQLEVLRLSADQRHCAAGTIVCRKGSIGRSFFVVAAGGVRVLHDAAPGRRSTSVFLGPGQVFGEMSLLSDLPVSATVVAATDTLLYTFPKRTLLTLFNDHPVVRDAVVRLLIDRLRHRSASDADRPAAPCALVVVPATHHETRTVTEAIARAVAHYAPGSCIVDTRHPPTRDTATVEPPSFFPDGIGPLRSRSLGEIRVYLSGATGGWHRELIGAWRRAGSIGQLLLLVVAEDQADDLSEVLIADDVVLLIIGAGIGETRASSDRVFGLAAVERPPALVHAEVPRRAQAVQGLSEKRFRATGSGQPVFNFPTLRYHGWFSTARRTRPSGPRALLSSIPRNLNVVWQDHLDQN